jgi:hypothetical protein
MWVKFGLFILGGWLGATTGMMIYNAVLSSLIGNTTSAQTIFIIYMAIFVVAGGLLTMWLYNHAMAIGSSIVGAYALIRGLGVFIGDFPNEYLVYLELSKGSQASMPDEFFVYLGCYIVVAVAGLVYQEKDFVKALWAKLFGKIKEKIGKKKGKEDEEEIEEEKADDEEKPLLDGDKKKKDKK